MLICMAGQTSNHNQYPRFSSSEGVFSLKIEAGVIVHEWVFNGSGTLTKSKGVADVFVELIECYGGGGGGGDT